MSEHFNSILTLLVVGYSILATALVVIMYIIKEVDLGNHSNWKEAVDAVVSEFALTLLYAVIVVLLYKGVMALV